MASGRRDYWVGFETGKSMFAPLQTPVFEYGFKDVAASGTDSPVDYTVPAGYQFHLISATIAAKLPGINAVYLGLPGLGVRFSYFDVNYMFPVTDGGDTVLDEGANLLLWVDNMDGVEVRFYGSVYGYLIPKT